MRVGDLILKENTEGLRECETAESVHGGIWVIKPDWCCTSGIVMAGHLRLSR